jgi:hypothetical protein
VIHFSELIEQPNFNFRFFNNGFNDQVGQAVVDVTNKMNATQDGSTCFGRNLIFLHQGLQVAFHSNPGLLAHLGTYIV